MFGSSRWRRQYAGREGHFDRRVGDGMRIRVAAVAVLSGDVLVISRRKDGKSYCVLPGGGVESGETLRAACVRELNEETGLIGTELTLLDVPVDSEVSAVYFKVAVQSRSVRLGGPERARASESNSYEPKWIPVTLIDEGVLVPESARLVVAAVAHAEA